jgi:hypothetical protein
VILSWIARLAASPLVARILIPAISNALHQFFESQAKKLETRGAVKAAKAAKTAEQIREASKRLSDASTR